MKRILAIMSLSAVLLSGCAQITQQPTSNSETFPQSTPASCFMPATTSGITQQIYMDNEQFGHFLANTKEIVVYQIKDGANQSFSYTVNGKTHTQLGEQICRMNDDDGVLQLVQMFSGWDITQNQVPPEEILDLACMVCLCFDSGLVIEYGDSDCRFYGRINGRAYYLPPALGEFIDGLTDG